MRRYVVTLGSQDAPVEVEINDEPAAADGTRRVRISAAGEDHTIDLRLAGPHRYTWLEGHRVVTAEVSEKTDKLSVAVRGETFTATVADANVAHVPMVGPTDKASGPLVVKAPMPGRVVKLLVRAGDDVKLGRGIIVVEAMKMENELRAPRDGKVKEVNVTEGEAVETGQPLFVLE